MNLRINDLIEQQEEAQINSFYISFSDLMVLLCVFFVMIIGISRVDIGSFEKVRSGFAKSKSGTLVELADTLKKAAKKTKGVSVAMASDGVRVDFESAALFRPGRAVLKQDYLKPIRPMLLEIKNSKYTLEVEGHTEDRPFFRKNGDEIETNWSLSGKRAGAMADYLISLGFAAKRIHIVGYGFTRPKVKIEGLSGAKLSRARAKNRRVTILVR